MRVVWLRSGLVVIVVGMIMATASRARIWSGPARGLWTEAVSHSPEKPRPWINLAQTSHEGDRLAIKRLEHAIALSLTPARQRLEGPMRVTDHVRLNLAILHAQAGRYEEALALTAIIQPRIEGRASIVNQMERQWRLAQTHGAALSAAF